MGIVYRAQAPDGQVIALKVLRAPLTDVEFRARFEREARVRIDHPNVVRVVDAGFDAALDAPFLGLELLEGVSLEDRLQRGPLSHAELIDVGSQACLGLHEAHLRGVVHRDLKPSNLFCSFDGTVKVLDFGIALTSGEARITVDKATIGTPAYMSPEQVRGERVLDARTDVWSLGVVLYEAACCHSPFVRDTPLASMLAVHMEEAEPLWVRARQLPRGVAQVIERAMAKKRELRFSNAAEFGQALRESAGADVSRAATQAVESIGDAGPASFAPISFAPTSAMSVPPQSRRSLLPEDERRIVAVILAVGVLRLDVVEAAIVERGGVVIPLVGNRAIGVFGAERWDGDEVKRAAYAAIAIRDVVEKVSLASGRATSVGGAISGDVLKAAEAGCERESRGVAISATSARILGDEFSVAQTGEGALELFAVKETSTGTSDQARLAIYGRSVELAQIRDAITRVGDEQRAVVLLATGPPGVGKTRLRQAFGEQLSELVEGTRVLSVRAEPLWKGRAYATMSALLSGRMLELSLATGGMGERDLVFELAKEALGNLEQSSQCADFLGELLGAVRDAPSEALLAARADPQLMLDRLRLALLDYFECLGREQTLVLAIEDLQWADSATLQIIEEVIERLAERPLLVFATARTEFLEDNAGPWTSPGIIRLEPRSLAAADVASFAEDLAGRRLSADLVRSIADRTAGHPLFVEQVVLELVDRQMLDAEVSELPSTLTVDAAVQSRLDYLPVAEKDACKRAAIFGRPFLTHELDAMGAIDAKGQQARLVRREIWAAKLRADRKTREHAFKSSLFGDSVYAMLADEARAELHRRAAALLTDGGADDEEIARHHDRGNEPAKASRRYASTAISAAESGDAATVLRCSGRAFELGVAEDLAFELHMARSDALRFLGMRDEQAIHLEKALAVAVSDRELARVLTERTVLFSRSGRPADATESAEQAVAAAERAADIDVLTMARGWLVGAHIFAGRVAEARVVYDVAIGAAESASTRVRAMLEGWRAHLAMAVGDHGERLDAFGEAVRLYREAGDVRRACAAEGNLADVFNRVGAYSKAESALRDALENARRVGNTSAQGYALVNLGYALARQDRVTDACLCFADAQSVAETTREARLGLFAQHYSARFGPTSANDRARSALRVAEDALELADHTIEALARANAATGLLPTDPQQALAQSKLALTIVELRGGIEEDEAEVYLARIAALKADGQLAEASDLRMQARKRIELVAVHIKDPEVRLSFLEAVTCHRELFAE